MLTKKEDVLRIIAMRDEGKTVEEIAHALSLTRSGVYYWIKRLKKAGHAIPQVRNGGREPLDLSR
jgi:transposase